MIPIIDDDINPDWDGTFNFVDTPVAVELDIVVDRLVYEKLNETLK